MVFFWHTPFSDRSIWDISSCRVKCPVHPRLTPWKHMSFSAKNGVPQGWWKFGGSQGLNSWPMVIWISFHIERHGVWLDVHPHIPKPSAGHWPPKMVTNPWFPSLMPWRFLWPHLPKKPWPSQITSVHLSGRIWAAAWWAVPAQLRALRQWWKQGPTGRWTIDAGTSFWGLPCPFFGGTQSVIRNPCPSKIITIGHGVVLRGEDFGGLEYAVYTQVAEKHTMCLTWIASPSPALRWEGLPRGLQSSCTRRVWCHPGPLTTSPTVSG